MRQTIHIADTLSLPLAGATETFAFLGRRGSGKTYGATKLAEELLKSGVQVVAVDPVGSWWGLRLAADGKSPGIAIPVFGGLHGDVPLESTGGVLMADLITDRAISAVVDVSQMTSSEQMRFMKDFGKRLFENKKRHPSALMIFLEECQEFLPQNPQRDEAQVLHHWQRIVKLGRNFGIGITLISQRPQEVHKRVLNLTEVMFAFQMTGPHERRAMRDWISDKGEEVSLVDRLPHLPKGTAYVWSPQWLQFSGEVKVGRKTTFDSSSTPEVGKAAKESRPLAPVDLDEIRIAMAATIERAKADDPKELRKTIASLEAKLKQSGSGQASEHAIQQAVEGARQRGFEAGRQQALQFIDTMRLNAKSVIEELDRVHAKAQSQIEGMKKFTGGPRELLHAPSVPAPKTITSPVVQPSNGSMDVGKSGLLRMLIALAQCPEGLTDQKLGLRSGVSVRGGSFRTYLSKGKASGWIDGPRNCLRITQAGMDSLGQVEPLPTGAGLADYWGQKITTGARRMLDALIEVYPRTLSDDQLGEKSGVSVSGGSFRTYLSRLRGLDLIEGPRSALKASEELI